MNFELTYFHITDNIKDRQLECLPSGKVRGCARELRILDIKENKVEKTSIQSIFTKL